MKHLLVTIALIFSVISSFQLKAQETGQPQKVNFYDGSYDNFLREARKQNKAAVLYFWASWCTTCKQLDIETFSETELNKQLNQNFLVYKVNVDTFGGIEIANRFGVATFPTVIKLDSRGKFKEKKEGFVPPNDLKEMVAAGEQKATI